MTDKFKDILDDEENLIAERFEKFIDEHFLDLDCDNIKADEITIQGTDYIIMKKSSYDDYMAMQVYLFLWGMKEIFHEHGVHLK